jgi:hypothetical protein
LLTRLAGTILSAAAHGSTEFQLGDICLGMHLRWGDMLEYSPASNSKVAFTIYI